MTLAEATSQFRRQFIIQTLEYFSWNQSRAANRLGVHRNTLERQMEKLAIRNPRLERVPAAVQPIQAESVSGDYALDTD